MTRPSIAGAAGRIASDSERRSSVSSRREETIATPSNPRRAPPAKARPWAIENLPISGGRVADLVTEGDPQSRPVAHHRVVDTIGQLARNGTISHEMALAAKGFARDFRAAHLGGIRTAVLVRVDSSRGTEAPPGNEAARRRVLRDMEALGGLGAPAAQAVWHVVGLEESLREWSHSEAWQGKPMRYYAAQGVLVAALGVLARLRLGPKS